jgi:ankyrin repeat protein
VRARIRGGAVGLYSLRAIVPPVQALLAGGAYPDAKSTGNGNTALMTAAASGRNDIVRVLLAAGADADARQPTSEYTSLMFGAPEGHAGDARSLISSGADANARSANGDTALTLAGRGDKTAAARVLSKSGAH